LVGLVKTAVQREVSGSLLPEQSSNRVPNTRKYDDGIENGQEEPEKAIPDSRRGWESDYYLRYFVNFTK
jgi:hypothetical protein